MKNCEAINKLHKYGPWKNFRYGWDQEEPTAIWQRFCVECKVRDEWCAPPLEGLPDEEYAFDSDARPPGFTDQFED